MTTYEKEVYNLCNKGKDCPYQIVVRNISCGILKLLDNSPSREDIMLASYDVKNLLDVINPTFRLEINYLKDLYTAVFNLQNDKLNINLLLGIPKEC